MFIHTRSVCLHQDPWILVLTSDCFSHSWICGFLRFSAAPCGLGIVHDELCSTQILNNYLTQLLFDIFGFRKDRSYIVIIVPFILYFTLKKNTENFIFMINIIHAVCVCAKWNTFELLWMWSHMNNQWMYLFSYVALGYMYTFFIIITCIFSKCLLYDFQVLIHLITTFITKQFFLLMCF